MFQLGGREASMDKKVYEQWKTTRYTLNQTYTFDDTIAMEFPFTIFIQGEEFATIVCTPTHIEELTVGFLASEGIILQTSDITSIQIDETKGFVYIELHKTMPMIEHDHSKRFIGSCCGKSRQFYFKSDAQTARTIYTTTSITVAQCVKLMNDMQEHSELFKATGGVHNTALATSDAIITVREDIGRHNTLDKIYGHMLQQHIRPSDKIIVFSGRLSSEALLKVSKMGIGIIISNAAPTNLALQLANDLQITTIGFVRNEQMNVYTYPERVKEG